MPNNIYLPDANTELIDGDNKDFEKAFEQEPELILSVHEFWQHLVCDILNSTDFQE
jgi:hypothetical protein